VVVLALGYREWQTILTLPTEFTIFLDAKPRVCRDG